MASIGKIARRTFLIGTAAVAGGVAFGVYAAKRPLPNPLFDDLAEGEAAITPYVKIDASGVTLITPRADKGQGAYSLQAHLLAEELDVDPQKVALSPGMPDPAYYNSEVMQEGSPFPAYDDGWMAQQVRGLLEVVPKFLGMQMTGGSSTTPEAFVKLRAAGASARETLKEAAAQRTGVARDRLKTEDGFVITPDGEKIAYTELAASAAGIAPIQGVALRPESQWRYVGKPMQRVDIVAKSTGTEMYGIDLRMEGMVYASVRANPGIGGEVASFDASAAENMRGVKKIVPIQSGVGVIADNTWRAIQAVNAIDIEWGPGPYPASSAEMWQTLESSMTEEFFDHRQRNDGDVDEALSSGDVVEMKLRVPHLAHAPLEPMNAIARYSEDKLEIWTGTQIPGFIRTHAAKLTGLDEGQIYVYVQPMGGSFGRRLEDTYVMQTVELAMAMPNTPVKMTWSREEDMTHDYPRPMQLATARGKVVDGQVEAMDLSVVGASLAASWFGRLMGPLPGPDATITTGSWDQPFGLPHQRVSGYRAPEMVPISSWRSVGASSNGFFYNAALEELIHAAGADPLEERLRLCIHDLSRNCLEEVGKLSNWGSDLGPNRGRGLAFTLSFGVPTAMVVEVTNTEAGIKIDQVYAVVEVGKVVDPINLEAQMTGGAIFGLGHAMNCELTYEDYAAQQDNYYAFEAMRLHQAPEIVTKVLTNGPKVRGIGEPCVPPAAPALAAAIFDATGTRLREMPFHKFVDFV